MLSDKFEEESSDEEIDVSNPLTGYWAIVFDIVNVVVANIDFLSVFVA